MRTPQDDANVRRDFRRVIAAAGLVATEWTPRELRHSLVSLLSDDRDRDREERDRLAEDIIRLFTKNGNPPPKLVDRRKNTSHGYRAVHIIVFIDGVPVKIQLRTKLQHEWADLFEKLADRIGRGIRYGEPPDHWRDKVLTPNIEAAERSSAPEMEAQKRAILEELYMASYRLREATIRIAHSLSDLIDAYERHASIIPPDQLAELEAGITKGFADMRSYIDEFGPLPTSS